MSYRFPECDKISPPLLQLSETTFGYTPDRILLKHINIDVGLESRIAIVGANGAGKCVFNFARFDWTLTNLVFLQINPVSVHSYTSRMCLLKSPIESNF